jgi:hypothetical protein
MILVGSDAAIIQKFGSLSHIDSDITCLRSTFEWLSPKARFFKALHKPSAGVRTSVFDC